LKGFSRGGALKGLLRRFWILGFSPALESGVSMRATINAADRTSSFTALSLACMRAVGPEILNPAMALCASSFFGHIVDYYLKPGGNYFGAKQGLKPVSSFTTTTPLETGASPKFTW
jgi:hypothetical protein